MATMTSFASFQCKPLVLAGAEEELRMVEELADVLGR